MMRTANLFIFEYLCDGIKIGKKYLFYKIFTLFRLLQIHNYLSLQFEKHSKTGIQLRT